jgi:glucokinase
VAQEILTTAGYYLGIGLANLINLFSPEKIILGGGVMKAGDLILESTKGTLLDITKASSLGSSVEICEAALGDESGVIGALMIARANDR